MKIMVQQNGLDLGPYTLEEAKGLLAVGMLNEDDLALPEGASDWQPLKNVVSAPQPSPLTSVDKARSTTSAISQPKPNPLTTTDKTRSAASASSQSKPSPLTSATRARSAGSAGSQATSTRPAFLARSAGTTSSRQKEKTSEMNQLLVSCVVGAGILILVALSLMVFAPGEIAKLLDPMIQVGPISSGTGSK